MFTVMFIKVFILPNNTQHYSGVDILQKRKPENAQEGINSAKAKFSDSPKEVFLLLRNYDVFLL